MATRTTSGTAAPGRSRTGNNPTAGNGEAPPVLAVNTNDKGQICSHIRHKWLAESPVERVRQAYVVTLHNEYGFDLDHTDEKLHVAGGGSAVEAMVLRTTPVA